MIVFEKTDFARRNKAILSIEPYQFVDELYSFLQSNE